MFVYCRSKKLEGDSDCCVGIKTISRKNRNKEDFPPFIDCIIGGIKLSCLADSGASTCFLSTKIADLLEKRGFFTKPSVANIQLANNSITAVGEIYIEVNLKGKNKAKIYFD